MFSRVSSPRAANNGAALARFSAYRPGAMREVLLAVMVACSSETAKPAKPAPVAPSSVSESAPPVASEPPRAAAAAAREYTTSSLEKRRARTSK